MCLTRDDGCILPWQMCVISEINAYQFVMGEPLTEKRIPDVVWEKFSPKIILVELLGLFFKLFAIKINFKF